MENGEVYKVWREENAPDSPARDEGLITRWPNGGFVLVPEPDIGARMDKDSLSIVVDLTVENVKKFGSRIQLESFENNFTQVIDNNERAVFYKRDWDKCVICHFIYDEKSGYKSLEEVELEDIEKEELVSKMI
jgi:hypothetical protein